MDPKNKVVLIRDPTLFEMEQGEKSFALASSLGDFVRVERPYGEKNLLLGTSAFTADGWAGSFKTIRRRRQDLKIYAYANNHYQGHGPDTVKLFWDLYKG
jgi:uncharacterized protein YecE (DUF72 family)